MEGMRKSLALGTAVVAVAIAAGCGGSGTHARGPVAPTATGTAGSAGCKVRSIARPLGQTRAGGTVVLAKIGTKSVALIADEDARAVTVIDLETQKELGSTPVDGAPSQLMVTTDGRILVLLRDRSRIQVLEAESAPASLVTRCSIETPPEPVSLASAPDDSLMFVSSAWGRMLTAYEGDRFARSFEVALPREPRAVVISDDGATAFVSHAVGSVVSAVDLKKPAHPVRAIAMVGADAGIKAGLRQQRKQIARMKADGQITDEQAVAFEKRLHMQDRVGCQGFALAKSAAPAGRILAPQVLVDPGTPEERPEGYGSGRAATESPSIAVIDDTSAAAFESSLTIQRGLDWRGDKSARDHREECLLPRAAAVDPKSRMLLVSCFGIDNVIAYDAASADPQAAERRRWSVGAGPSGIAVDPEQPRAFVWSQFDRTLSVLPLGGSDLTDDKGLPPSRVAKIALAPLANKLPVDFALGRIVFHSAGDSRISKDGRACASCHPDGRDDAITWATPEGPRRSIMLAGRVNAVTRFAWNGTTKTLNDHLQNTFDRLDGTGLKSLELEGLVAYLAAMRPPVPQQDAHAADPKVARGAQIFASKEAACATCHAGANFTDGALHDVKSKADSDRGSTFKTPTLRFVGGTGPYFHDGRYKTLHDLLRDVDGKMGNTKQLSENDLDSLEAYLRTL
jgi:DNA-binding beta-propeller fold protein YncE/mono/diheme cytochrome c family protein